MAKCEVCNSAGGVGGCGRCEDKPKGGGVNAAKVLGASWRRGCILCGATLSEGWVSKYCCTDCWLES